MKKVSKLLNFLVALVVTGCFSSAFADTTAAATAAPTPAVSVGGLVDAYYTYNFTNGSNSKSGVGNNSSVYFYNATDASFSLGLAEISATATLGQTSARLVLADIMGNPVGLTNPGIDVLQGYVTYNPGQWTFTAGKFVTWLGQEVIESKSNWNYTHSLLFQYAIPYWHTGLSAMYMPDPTFMVTGYVVNGWQTLASPTVGSSNLGFTYGLQVGITPSSTWKFILNGIAGPQGGVAPVAYNGAAKYVGEAIVNFTATDKLSFALDFNYDGFDNVASGATTVNATAWGAALYARYQIESDWAVALRLEEVKDAYNMLGLYFNNGAATTIPMGTATDMEAREATLTVEHNFSSNMLLRLEGRMDMAYSGGTQYSSSTTPVGPFAGGSGTQTTGTASMVFSF